VREREPVYEASKGKGAGTPKAKQEGDDDKIMSADAGAEQENKDPVSVLEEHGCSVFMPDVIKNKLDWDYLAGYAPVKR